MASGKRQGSRVNHPCTRGPQEHGGFDFGQNPELESQPTCPKPSRHYSNRRRRPLLEQPLEAPYPCKWTSDYVNSTDGVRNGEDWTDRRHPQKKRLQPSCPKPTQPYSNQRDGPSLDQPLEELNPCTWTSDYVSSTEGVRNSEEGTDSTSQQDDSDTLADSHSSSPRKKFKRKKTKGRDRQQRDSVQLRMAPVEDNTLYLRGRFQDRDCVMIVDTGSSHSVMPWELFNDLAKKCKHRFRQKNSSGRLADGSRVPMYGVGEIDISSQKQRGTLQFRLKHSYNIIENRGSTVRIQGLRSAWSFRVFLFICCCVFFHTIIIIIIHVITCP